MVDRGPNGLGELGDLLDVEVVGSLDGTNDRANDDGAVEIGGWRKSLAALENSAVPVTVDLGKISELGLEESPAKVTDKRGDWEGGTVQCEAIDPRTLAEIMRTAILEHIDEDQLMVDQEEEEEERAILVEKIQAMRKD